jgi:hypothetical protein
MSMPDQTHTISKETNNGIGTLNEKTLHSDIKTLYLKKGAQSEMVIDGYVIDVVLPNRLIEIQTRSFSNLKRKLAKLLINHKVTLVHPIAAEKIITVYDKTMTTVLRSQKSPKKGQLIDIVDELIYIPHLLTHPNLRFEALLIKEHEIRCNNGKGSWRRNGVSIVNRHLDEMLESYVFKKPSDYKRLLPKGLPKQFTNQLLVKEFGIKRQQVYKLTSLLKKIGILHILKIQNRTQIFTLSTKGSLSE